MVDDPELIELVELEVRELLSSTSSPATTARSSGRGAQGFGRRPSEMGTADPETDGRGGQLYSDAGA